MDIVAQINKLLNICYKGSSTELEKYMKEWLADASKTAKEISNSFHIQQYVTNETEFDNSTWIQRDYPLLQELTENAEKGDPPIIASITIKPSEQYHTMALLYVPGRYMLVADPNGIKEGLGNNDKVKRRLRKELQLNTGEKMKTIIIPKYNRIIGFQIEADGEKTLIGGCEAIASTLQCTLFEWLKQNASLDLKNSQRTKQSVESFIKKRMKPWLTHLLDRAEPIADEDAYEDWNVKEEQKEQTSQNTEQTAEHNEEIQSSDEVEILPTNEAKKISKDEAITSESSSDLEMLNAEEHKENQINMDNNWIQINQDIVNYSMKQETQQQNK